MDFLKMLLAYMALMATLGVQTGPALDAVPTPTALPSHVTPTLVPHMTEAPTATPSPEPAPTPAITPNYRYDTLNFGSSGTQVRKLQNRLIELGYMPKGSADSQYGYQTYNAVKAFQGANKLSADGVAGAITLTHLYENPYVVGVVEETAVPTATPTPSWEPFPTPDGSETATPTVNVIPLPEEMTAAPEAAPELPETLPEAHETLPEGWTDLQGGFIISSASGTALYLKRTVDGQDALIKPALYQTADGDAAVSLPELAECLGWTLADTDGVCTLSACGYEVAIRLMDEAIDVTADGVSIPVDMGDAVRIGGQMHVTGDFLRQVLNAEVVLDVDESSLVLFLVDKSVANAQD